MNLHAKYDEMKKLIEINKGEYQLDVDLNLTVRFDSLVPAVP